MKPLSRLLISCSIVVLQLWEEFLEKTSTLRLAIKQQLLVEGKENCTSDRVWVRHLLDSCTMLNSKSIQNTNVTFLGYCRQWNLTLCKTNDHLAYTEQKFRRRPDVAQRNIFQLKVSEWGIWYTKTCSF